MLTKEFEYGDVHYGVAYSKIGARRLNLYGVEQDFPPRTWMLWRMSDGICGKRIYHCHISKAEAKSLKSGDDCHKLWLAS